MDSEITSELNELALASRVLAMNGHEDLTLGHVALRDPQGRGIWMKRRGIGLSEVLGAGDFVLLDFDGKQIEGEGRPHSEWPLHSEPMLARPDIRVSAHTHPEYATLACALPGRLPILTQDGLRIRQPSFAHFEATADLVRTRDVGREFAGALGDARVVFMRNHGTSFFAESVAELALTGVSIERAARAYFRFAATGETPSEPDPETVPGLLGASESPNFVADNWSFLCRQLAVKEGLGRER